MKLNVFGQDGKKTATEVELNDKIYNIDPVDHAIWLDIRLINANKRQGTHQTKGRSFVSGGGRKPFKQKGTGRARQGTIRAPHHVGGGRVFGPNPRNYLMKVNKKVKSLARRSALSYKMLDQKVLVVENFNIEKPSTKDIVNLLSGFNLNDKKVLFCTAENSPAIVKSAANLYKVNVVESATFSTYDILHADTLVLQEGAVNKINEVLG